jgi:hypothetical protein
MGIINDPVPMKLVCGILSRQDNLEAARERLRTHFGQIESEFPPIPFTYTDYYREEMGEGLFRSWVSFSGFVEPDFLPKAKIMTHRIEEEFARPDGTRKVNLDPGLMDEAKLILASTKNFAHRIYLGHGIYAEVTLIYRQGSFQSLPWTYPDYGDHREFFNEVRRRLKDERKKTSWHGIPEI